MKRVHCHILLPVPIAALLLVLSCDRMVEQDAPVARAVTFSASTGYEPETRTAFSGEVSGDSRTFERIDWVNGDCISICSAEAETAAGAHAADYAVTASSADGVRSLAAVRSSDPLLWGEGTNTFYALYPAPGSEGADPALALSPGTVSAVIPATQSLTASGSVFKPDMHYAYMAAVAKVDSPDVPGPVSLVFKPMVTTYELNLLNFATDPVESDLTVVRLRSTADGARLSGGFTASLNADGSYAAAPAGEGTDAVSATLPAGTRLSDSNALQITLFTLPVDQAGIQIELEFASGLVRRLPLADGGAPITVPAGEKIYLDNVTVPDGWAYHIEVSTPAALTYAGGTTSFTVRSYRSKKSVTENVPWTASFSASPDGPFSETPPEGFTLSSVSGDGSPISLNVTCSAQDYTSARIDLTGPQHARFAANSASPRGTQEHPFDLSMHSLITASSRAAGQPVTANCYVVDRAGWYMFPLVYGNAIDFNLVADASSNQGGNQNAYMPQSEEDSYAFMTPFQNAAGVGMVSPYILDDVAACGFVDAATLAAHDLDAVIVWQDVEAGKEIVTHPEILWVKPDASNADSGLPCPYIRFQAFENTANFAQGNALIALRDISAAADKSNVRPNEATILWSWHIWLTDTAFPGDLKKTAVKVSSFGKTYNWMMPSDLGYCEPDYRTENSYEGRTCYVRISHSEGSYVLPVVQNPGTTIVTKAGSHPSYQFGRKDPLLPCDGTDEMYNKHYVSGAGYEIACSSKGILVNHSGFDVLVPSSTDNSNVGLANRYPYVYLWYGASWVKGKRCHNFWNATNTTATYAIQNVRAYTDVRVVKCVYDPCPPDFSMPHQNAFTFFTDNGHSSNHTSYDNIEGTLDPAETPGVDGIWFKCLNDDTGIFFPFSGGRFLDEESNTEAVFINVKREGSYWVASQYDAGGGANGSNLTYACHTNGRLLTLNSWRYGLTVRPVVEEHLIASVPLGD